jgi:hypothetical protein
LLREVGLKGRHQLEQRHLPGFQAKEVFDVIKGQGIYALAIK